MNMKIARVLITEELIENVGGLPIGTEVVGTVMFNYNGIRFKEYLVTHPDLDVIKEGELPPRVEVVMTIARVCFGDVEEEEKDALD